MKAGSTCSKLLGTEDAITVSLMTLGAPLMKINAEPSGASSDVITTPDLRVWELKSSTRRMLRFTMLALERLSGRRGNTRLLRSYRA